MRIRKFALQSNKKYLMAFILVMLLNIVIGVFLLQTVIAQKSADDFRNQLPIVAKVAFQENSPLLITVVNIDNSNTSYQVANYTLQNISGKSIRGYVIWGGEENAGKVTTNFLPARAFQNNTIHTEELIIERANIKPEKTISLTVDYVEFDDGSSWGEDILGQSEHIAGGRAGAEAAAEQLKNIIEKRESAVLSSMLKQPLVDLEVPLPEIYKSKSEKWQDGFRNGYKSIVGFIKSMQEGKEEELIKKLGEIKNNLQKERRKSQ